MADYGKLSEGMKVNLLNPRPGLEKGGPKYIFFTHVCKDTYKHIPQSQRRHMQTFWTLVQILSPPPLHIQTKKSIALEDAQG